jgi:hypothetical protein
MPNRSNTMRYHVGCAFEITLDIADVQGAIFKGATFTRGDGSSDWGFFAYDQPSPDLITLYLEPRLPEGQVDNTQLPLEQTLGQLTVSFTFTDPKGAQTLVSAPSIPVAPSNTNGCDFCPEDADVGPSLTIV